MVAAGVDVQPDSEPGAPDAEAVAARTWSTYEKAAGVLAVVTLLWRGWTTARWTWADDDWVYLANTRTLSFWHYLFQDYNGHLMPAQFLVTWVMTKAAPLQFWVPIVLVALASGASAWLWSRVYAELAGERLWLLVPQSLLALGPVLIHPINWWASAVQVLPLQLCAGWMVLAAARLGRTGERRHLGQLVLAFVVGLAFWEKALLLVIPALAVLLQRLEVPARRRVRQALPSMLALGSVAAAYVVVFLLAVAAQDTQGSTSAGLGGHRSAGEVSSFFWRGFTDLLAPSLLGGPWGTLPTPGTIYDRPPQLIAWGSALVVLALVAWALARLRGAWLPLTMVAGYVAVAWGLVLYSARYTQMGGAVVNEERYLVDTYLVAFLAVAMLAPLPRRQQRPPAARGRRRATVVAFGALALASLTVGNVLGVRTIGVHPGRSWVDHVTSDVAKDAPVTVLDTYAPDAVQQAPFWLDDARMSRLLSPLPGTSFHRPAEQLWLVDADGHLRKVAVQTESRAQPGPVEGCGYGLDPGRAATAPLSGELYAWDWVVQVNTFTGGTGTLSVDVGGTTTSFDVGSGLQQHQFEYTGAVPDSVGLTMTTGQGTVCVTDVLIGKATATSG